MFGRFQLKNIDAVMSENQFLEVVFQSGKLGDEMLKSMGLRPELKVVHGPDGCNGLGFVVFVAHTQMVYVRN